MRELRQDIGYSAAEAAAHLGYRGGANTITGWERGERTLHVQPFYALCKVYETDPRHVLDVIERRTARYNTTGDVHANGIAEEVHAV